MNLPRFLILSLIALPSLAWTAAFNNPYGKVPTNATPGDKAFASYFRSETRQLAERCLAEFKTLEEWDKQRGELRRQIYDMLGLAPVPPKTDLKTTITGTLDHPEFTVEK